MGGGDNSAAAAVIEEQLAPSYSGQMRTFGAGQASNIQSQLNRAGLGGFIDPSQYQATTVPVFSNPAQVAEYVQSQGLTPATVAAAATTAATNTGEGAQVVPSIYTSPDADSPYYIGNEGAQDTQNRNAIYNSPDADSPYWIGYR